MGSMIAKRVAAVAFGVAVGAGGLGAGIGNAQTVAAPAVMMTDPPGACASYERGTYKIDPATEQLYECVGLAGEGYYWLPV